MYQLSCRAPLTSFTHLLIQCFVFVHRRLIVRTSISYERTHMVLHQLSVFVQLYVTIDVFRLSLNLHKMKLWIENTPNRSMSSSKKNPDIYCKKLLHLYEVVYPIDKGTCRTTAMITLFLQLWYNIWDRQRVTYTVWYKWTEEEAEILSSMRDFFLNHSNIRAEKCSLVWGRPSRNERRKLLKIYAK